MELEDRQKKIFFDVITELTGHTQKVGHIDIGLTREHIIKRVSAKIPKTTTEKLFDEFKGNYIEEQKDEPTYRISASGREYYFDVLIPQSQKETKEVELLQSNIKTQIFTRRNILFAGGIAVAGLVFIISGFIVNILREVRESQKEVRDLQQQIIQLQTTGQTQSPNPQTTFQIQFPDSLKIKIEK